MNGADLLCETLLANDIDVCFANPGTSEMHFVAALDRQPGMRCILGLFEGVVTGAADGYARMADKPAATLLHLGPGLANGLANLHNAKRARTPVINVVGEHATHHLPYDAPLTSDIESLARPMSHWIGRAAASDEIGQITEAAIREARAPQGRISTLILPADVAWSETTAKTPRKAALSAASAPDMKRIEAAANALRNGQNTTILVTGLALRQTQLEKLGRIARKTGARLMAQQSNGRLQRGAGRVPIDRVPYVIDKAVACFAETAQVVLIGAKAPVGFFAYPGKPSSMLPDACKVIDMIAEDDDLPLAVDMLADVLGVDNGMPIEIASRHRPDLAAGKLTPEAIAIALAHYMPANAIVCDESVSSGRDFFHKTHGAEPHDFLQLTGGAIGIGLPMATGAAIACPDRKVISLQADGSGMYTVQSLWTQARERTNTLTIVFANRRYAILHGELKNVGAGVPGANARQMLDLDNPALDWVGMANAMGVEAARAETAERFADILSSACGRNGPFLIEAII
ncbi:acetolactate synthase-1/2/3 large subunit [Pseudaminobacter salicylatoxidans]|uniref:Acetolactate synthase-1/2/3 large subunit n=1 Tax=Pseudaminobacter salicylatoxidans TaxID=93369 RepID=A0A316CAQ9_PSESE|nr:acetolactate synthase large subunit [Pseudaminobacter salicylatoxidans]PWJ86166.1 acetolactate synthase-1/2/3 large subunit [Pseudaminobacter salicylatoxidans]